MARPDAMGMPGGAGLGKELDAARAELRMLRDLATKLDMRLANMAGAMACNIMDARNRTAPGGGGCEGQAPEGTSGVAAMQSSPANVCQNRPAPAPGRVARARPAPRDERPIAAIIQALEEADDSARCIPRKSAVDWARVAAARAAGKAIRDKRSAKAGGLDARPEAMSNDPCPRCGAAGRNGCAHRKPYVSPGHDGPVRNSGKAGGVRG